MSQPASSIRGSVRETLFMEIVESLKLLPTLHRRIFVRSHYQGRSLEEIGSELGIPAREVHSLLEDANQIFYRNLHRFVSPQ